MPKKIVICDDDQGIVEVMQIMLESQGYQVMTLFNGKSIIKKIREFNPQLIFIDVWMPGMDGREIVKLLKRDDQLKVVPVVLMTALSEGAKIAQEAKVAGFLTKPFEMTTLFELTDNLALNE